MACRAGDIREARGIVPESLPKAKKVSDLLVLGLSADVLHVDGGGHGEKLAAAAGECRPFSVGLMRLVVC